jgi:hypothetical protein
VAVLSGGLYNTLMLVLALAALAVAGVGLAYGRRALFPPKRQLAITAPPPVSLLSSESAAGAGIVVLRKGDDEPIISPHVVTLSVENVGKYPIDSDEYDQGRSIDIDLGVQIKTILETSMRSSTEDTFSHRFSGSEFLLGPDLLKSGDGLTVQLLTEGRPELGNLKKRVKHYLKNTKILYPQAIAPRRALLQRRFLIGFAALTVLAALAVTIPYLVFQVYGGPHVALAPDHGNSGTKITVHGNNCQKYSVIEVLLESYNGGQIPPTLATGQADATGTFTLRFTLPSNVPQGAINLEVTVNEANESFFEYLTFYVT